VGLTLAQNAKRNRNFKNLWSGQLPQLPHMAVYSRARAAVRSFEIEKGRKMQPDMDQRLQRRNFEKANGNFVFLNRNPAAKNSRPGKQFAGMAVEKKSVGGDLPPSERLRWLCCNL
jgi:hypothetical protein